MKKCCICGKRYEGYGNNALPVMEGRCCDYCNGVVVIPGRLRRWNEKDRMKELKKKESRNRSKV